MRPSVLVTDARRGSAIAFIRSLGARGWHVIAGDCSARSVGFRSRYAAERLVYPRPEHEPQAFVERLLERVRASRVDLVVPITDPCIHPLSCARERFGKWTRLAIAPAPALAAVTDKQATLRLARELGIPVPETCLPATRAEAEDAADRLRFPLVLKPMVSWRYSAGAGPIERGQVRFVVDRAQLDRCLEEPGVLGRVLLQRYEPGVGIGVEALARDGRVLHAFQHRRLAEIPLSGGASAWRESMALDPELFGHARDLIERLRWTGLIMVEFKVGRRPWLMEVNGRVWGSLPLACRSGVDFPGALADLYVPAARGEQAAPAPYRVGVRTYDLEHLLSWISQVLARRREPGGPARPARVRALAGLAGLLDPFQHSDLAGWSDLAPCLAEVGRIARKARRAALSAGKAR